MGSLKGQLYVHTGPSTDRWKMNPRLRVTQSASQLSSSKGADEQGQHYEAKPKSSTAHEGEPDEKRVSIVGLGIIPSQKRVVIQQESLGDIMVVPHLILQQTEEMSPIKGDVTANIFMREGGTVAQEACMYESIEEGEINKSFAEGHTADIQTYLSTRQISTLYSAHAYQQSLEEHTGEVSRGQLGVMAAHAEQIYAQVAAGARESEDSQALENSAHTVPGTLSNKPSATWIAALRRGIDKLHQAAGLEGTRWVTHQTTADHTPGSVARAKAVYNQLDPHHTGKLGMVDLAPRLSQAGVARRDIVRFFMFLDEDRDGCISLPEFVQGYVALEKQYGTM